jgi:hypothetical protein
MLVDEFRRQYERPSDHDLKPIGSLTHERERSPRGPRLPPWLLIGVVLVAVLVALFVIGTGGNNKKPQPVTGAHQQRPHHRKRHKAAPPPTPKTVKLELVPTGPVYVCVVNGAGTKLINQQTFSPGQAVPAVSGQKLLVTLGNNAVQMKVNGKTVPVTASASAIRMRIDPSGQHPISSATQPTCP